MKRVLISLGIFAVIALVFWRWQRTRSSLPAPVANSLEANSFHPNASTNSATSSPARKMSTESGITLANREELTRQFAENMRNDPNYIFKIKINFYGKVVDEVGNSVAGASVGFTWNKLQSNGGFETGHSETTSDEAGLFSLQEDAESNGLGVNVGKPGYFTVRADRSTFDYAQPYANNFLVPNPNSPVVFHLRKKQTGVPLITSKNEMGSDFSVAMPLNGIPIQVNLLDRKIGDGSLQISQVKPDATAWKLASEWSFQMAISDGGFVEYQNDEFPFEAPETGYQSAVEFHFKKGQSDWTEGLSKDYFIKFGNPPTYGRLHVETQIDFNGARLTYAINPDGTRNLEPQ